MFKRRKSNREENEDHEFMEGIDDQEDDVRAQLPSQEHCTWLLNIIRIHARKIANEVIKAHEDSVVKQLQQEVTELKDENMHLKAKLSDCQSEIGKFSWSRDGINRELVKKTRELDQIK